MKNATRTFRRKANTLNICVSLWCHKLLSATQLKKDYTMHHVQGYQLASNSQWTMTRHDQVTPTTAFDTPCREVFLTIQPLKHLYAECHISGTRCTWLLSVDNRFCMFSDTHHFLLVYFLLLIIYSAISRQSYFNKILTFQLVSHQSCILIRHCC